MLAINYRVVRRLRSSIRCGITEDRLDRFMRAAKRNSDIAAVILIAVAVYFLILSPLHRMVKP